MVVHLYWIWLVWEERRRQVGACEISGAHEAVWIHQIFSGKFERLVFHYEVNYLKPLSFPREGEGHHKIARPM